MRKLTGALFLTTAVAAAGCSRVGLRRAAEDFRRAEPPVTQTAVFGADTLFVVSTDAYDFASPVRSALWHRDVVDDVAWQYRRLFGAAPPRVAILLVDSSATVPGDVLEKWRGTAMAIVPLHAGVEETGDAGARERASRRARNGRGAVPPDLAFLAARAWLRATAIELAADSGEVTSDGTQGRHSRGPSVTPNFPAWFSAAATNLLATPGIEWELTAEVRERMSDVVSIDSLVAPEAGELAGRVLRFRIPSADTQAGRAPRSRERAAPSTRRRTAEPLFVAQATSLLQFIRERDPAFVAVLAERLAAGARFASALTASAALPHDTKTLDQQWRRWVRESASPGRRRRP